MFNDETGRELSRVAVEGGTPRGASEAYVITTVKLDIQRALAPEGHDGGKLYVIGSIGCLLGYLRAAAGSVRVRRVCGTSYIKT